MINELKHIFGPKCTAINVNGEFTEFVNIPSKQMKFCEAINHSFDIPLRLNNENLYCPGARRCTGYDNNDTQLSKTILENSNIPVQFIRSALDTIPKLKGIKHINLGMTGYIEKETPTDLYIIYTQPSMVTAIMQSLAKLEIKPCVPPYCLLSVCGNVFSNCYKNNVVSISFGCPESRKHGGIKKNEVVLGLPYKTALCLIELLKIK